MTLRVCSDFAAAIRISSAEARGVELDSRIQLSGPLAPPCVLLRGRRVLG